MRKSEGQKIPEKEIANFLFVKQNNPYIAVEVSKGLRRLFLYPGGDEKHDCKSKTANIKLRKGTVYMDKSKIKRLADYAINECCDHSEDCYWTISYDDLYYHFGAEVSDTNENGKLLEEELRQREEINELIMTEDCIEMTCHLQYCHNCQGNPVSLLSVLGCNIYDEHETEHHHEPANESSDEDETQALSM